MQKLLIKYRAFATVTIAKQIRAYDRSHPMARCMLSSADMDLLADAIHLANREG